jgi:predicted phage-related endonuclease
MLGVSPYKTRAALLRELATGIGAEVDAATQQRFDDGHRFEALARPLAEQIIGEELYACVGVDGRYSASFDGLTLMGETAWEHKTLSESLREAILRAEAGEDITGADLPEMYRAQMEHQCMVSDAQRVLFMATRWEGDQVAEQLSRLPGNAQIFHAE